MTSPSVSFSALQKALSCRVHELHMKTSRQSPIASYLPTRRRLISVSSSSLLRLILFLSFWKLTARQKDPAAVREGEASAPSLAMRTVR